MRTDAVTDFSRFAALRAAARADSPEAVRQAAQQFEALLLQQMLKSMRAARLGDDVLGGEQTEFYREMADAQLAQHLSAGKGLGIADLLVRQLTRGSTPDAAESAGRVSPPTTAATPAPVSAPRAGSEAETQRNSRLADFVADVLPHAEKAAAELGIPAKVLVAQAALETGWGRHAIRRADGSPALNFFGIKADQRWQGEGTEHMTKEYVDGQMRSERARFRAYGSVGQAFADYVHFLKSQPRYREALQHGGDPQRFVGGLQKAGYATDPQYAQKILRIAEGPALQRALAAVAKTRTQAV
ncbi:flagellar protein FlgJ [Fontimonas thermophila]|uniref:Peptidoglycan hydrolase FlgJ n=1 Tax=Fontimonas thermophila TaxID=1076937 RepID=A0A1I2JMN3_9GAMM|nr:flagellar assembly peptidoglycan hydrolase FlgJ [Fontimonas thermophila]SFF55499.1 flagellar protein FlgJ [Fontimonas thermophila]